MTALYHKIQHLANLPARLITRRRTRSIQFARAFVALLTMLALVGWSADRHGIARAGEAWLPIDGTLTAVNTLGSEQSDSHISGTLVAYWGNWSPNRIEVRYYNLLTGVDAAIPNGNARAYNPDVSGSTIVYTRNSDNRKTIFAFDTSTSEPPIELDPQAGAWRDDASIGNRTVAWIDVNTSEIVTYDMNTSVSTRLTNDQQYDIEPTVSSDGTLIVWAKCQTFDSVQYFGCDIWQAIRSGNGWTTMQLTSDANEERHPVTNGQVVVYTSRAKGVDEWGEQHISWQPIGGGIEQGIALPSSQKDVAIAGQFIVFANWDYSSGWVMLLYDLATGRIYHLRWFLDGRVGVRDLDIAVAQDGQIRVALTKDESSYSFPETDVYALTFRLPSSDRTPPNIAIDAPAAKDYTLKQAVVADYRCADEEGGSGLASCAGPLPSGSPIDTTELGAKTFTVKAADNAGNTASRSVNYNVTYRICALYDPGKSHRLGSVVPIKLQLCTAPGDNMSAPEIVVHALGLTQVDTTASDNLAEESTASPDNDFHYDPLLGETGGYIYNLSTRGLTVGTWELKFTVSGDPVTHTAQFDVR